MPNSGPNPVFGNGYRGLPLEGRHAHLPSPPHPPGVPNPEIVNPANPFAYDADKSYRGEAPVATPLLEEGAQTMRDGWDQLRHPGGHGRFVRRAIGGVAMIAAGATAYVNGVPLEIQQIARETRRDTRMGFVRRQAQGIGLHALAGVLGAPGNRVERGRVRATNRAFMNAASGIGNTYYNEIPHLDR